MEDTKKAMYKTAYHAASKKYCELMQYDAAGNRYFCNFGEAANPFTWVKAEELSNFVL